MIQTTTARSNLFAQVLDPANRPNPYPLYAQLRETPVSLQEDGIYVVSTYREIVALLHDPRTSSDERKRAPTGANVPVYDRGLATPSFINLDPPEHERVRRLVMNQFGPPRVPARVEGKRARINHIVEKLLDARAGQSRMDVVDDFAYPLPVTVICELLGVPFADEQRFHAWSDTLAGTLDLDPATDTPEHRQAVAEAGRQMREYLRELIALHRAEPGGDLLSGLAAGNDPEGRLDDETLLSVAVLLLIAGHETTVNLITNGVLTLLRHPHVIERLRREPDLIISTVEELLRYEPPVHYRPRTTLTEIDVAGVTIPKGAFVVLALASGSRDPSRFPDPDRFDPERTDNAHLGFNGGIHYCFGAPLARLEAQIALGEFVRRLENPRLVVDPPPYRANPALRGPRYLLVDFDCLRD
jgi:cytochrome P450